MPEPFSPSLTWITGPTGSSREHTTGVMVGADGTVTAVRIVWSDLPSPPVPEDPVPPPPPAPVPVTAATPARKRGRPRKHLPEEQSDQSLADVFAKRKR